MRLFLLYFRAVALAVFFQFVGSFIIAPGISDFGVFASHYRYWSIAFWVFAVSFIFLRRNPSILELVILAIGPLLIVGFMLFL